MRLRPCIDLHGGVVKQIVGSTLSTTGTDEGLVTNFTAEKSPAEFAKMYAELGLSGGHIIKLGGGNEEAALEALGAFPGGMQIGGGVTADNAKSYIDAGASHVIVTSYVFKNGKINMERLQALVDAVGKECLVLDLSCRKRPVEGGGHEYVVVTDLWQKWTDLVVTADTLASLSQYCSEFLVHGVDVEGKQCGVEEGLVALLAEGSPISVTYAGGVRDLEDMALVAAVGQGVVDVTIGSALDIFGGPLPLADVLKWLDSPPAAGAAATA